MTGIQIGIVNQNSFLIFSTKAYFVAGIKNNIERSFKEYKTYVETNGLA